MPFASAFDELLSISSKRIVDPLWKITERFTGRAKTAQDDQDIIAAPCYRMIEKRRREGFHGAKKDLLQWFLEAKDGEGNHLPDDLIKDMLTSITAAGTKVEEKKRSVSPRCCFGSCENSLIIRVIFSSN